MRVTLAIAVTMAASCTHPTELPRWPAERGSIVARIVEAPRDDVATARVVGTVVEVNSGEPVQAATLVADGDASKQSFVAATNSVGQFAFEAMPPGRYTVHVFYSDDLATPRFEIHAGRQTTLSLRVRYGGPSKNE